MITGRDVNLLHTSNFMGDCFAADSVVASPIIEQNQVHELEKPTTIMYLVYGFDLKATFHSSLQHSF